MTGRIWLGRYGSEILLPHFNRAFHEGELELGKKRRTASGRKVIDITSIKKKFTVTYSIIKEADINILKQIYEIYLTDGYLSMKIENSDNTIQEYMVEMEPFTRQRSIKANRWYWEGISIVLEEI